MSTTTRSRRARTGAGLLTAGAVLLGLVPLGLGTASAATPPPVQPTDRFCGGVPDMFDPFEDTAGNTFRSEIDCLYWAGITAGAGEGDPADPRLAYRPRVTVSRGQMATFIANTMDTAWMLDEEGNIRDLPEFDDVRGGFTDVRPSHPHYSGIRLLAAAGIAQGGPGTLPATRFAPDLPVSRAQMATFIARADAFMRRRPVPAAPDYFTDVRDATHRAGINAVASLGIAAGNGKGAFAPKADVTRGQMAAFLIRTLARLHADGLITELWDIEDVPDEDHSSAVAVDNQDGSATITFTLRNYKGDPIVGLGPDVFGLIRLDGDELAVEEVWVDELVDAYPGAWSFAEVGNGVYHVVHTSPVDTTFLIDLVIANWAFVAEDLRVTITGAPAAGLPGV